MTEYNADPADGNLPEIRELSKPQRRVLGTLVEKAFTVPESYPVTLKGLTAGCNQKSNRDPVSIYTEDAVWQAADELRKLGVVAVVHTESGRTERYRHYVRKRFTFTESQLAIITELLLRGRQQLGELRSRASRMVSIESLEDLRKEIDGLISQGYIRADGPLERRGVEVDHCFYLASENVQMTPRSLSDSEPSDSPTPSSPSRGNDPSESRALEELRIQQQELRIEIETLRSELEDVRDSLTQLKQSLGA